MYSKLLADGNGLRILHQVLDILERSRRCIVVFSNSYLDHLRQHGTSSTAKGIMFVGELSNECNWVLLSRCYKMLGEKWMNFCGPEPSDA